MVSFISFFLTVSNVLFAAAAAANTIVASSSSSSFDHDYSNYEAYVAIFGSIADRPDDPCQGFDESGPEVSLCTDVLDKSGFHKSTSSAASATTNDGVFGGRSWMNFFKGIFMGRAEKCWTGFHGLLFRRCPNIMDFNAFMEMAERLLDCAQQDPAMKKKHKMLISGTTMMLMIPGLCQTHLSLDIRRILSERMIGALERVSNLEDAARDDKRELGRLEAENARLVAEGEYQRQRLNDLAEQASRQTAVLRTENQQLLQAAHACAADRKELTEQKEHLEATTRRLEREIQIHIELRRELDRSWYGLAMHVSDSLYGFSLNVFEGSKDRLTLIALTCIVALLVYKIASAKRSSANEGTTTTVNTDNNKEPLHRLVVPAPPPRPPPLPSPYRRVDHGDGNSSAPKRTCLSCNERTVPVGKKKYCNVCRP